MAEPLVHNLTRQLDDTDLNSRITLIHLADLQQKAFSIGLKDSMDSISNQLPFQLS